MTEKQQLFQSREETYKISSGTIFEFIARLTDYAAEQCMIYKGANPEKQVAPIRASGFHQRFTLLASCGKGVSIVEENLADLCVSGEEDAIFTIYANEGLRVNPGDLYSLGKLYAIKTEKPSEE